MISRDNIKWQWIKGMGFSNVHHIVYRDSEHGLQYEVITHKGMGGQFRKPQHFYFIDGDDREFSDLDDLIEAYNEKFKFEGESPDHEVTFVKIIKKRTATP